MYLELDEINKTIVSDFYSQKNPGIIIIRDSLISTQILGLIKKVKHRKFSLKEYSHINQGQKYYNFDLPLVQKTGSDFATKSLIDIEAIIRSKLSNKHPDTILEYGFTHYPTSSKGANFHLDFSYNMNCTITFFFGATTMIIADTKQGENRKVYEIKPGDIVVMRAPINFSKDEIALRPIHAVGLVDKPFLAFEVREVNLERKNNVRKL